MEPWNKYRIVLEAIEREIKASNRRYAEYRERVHTELVEGAAIADALMDGRRNRPRKGDRCG